MRPIMLMNFDSRCIEKQEYLTEVSTGNLEMEIAVGVTWINLIICVTKQYLNQIRVANDSYQTEYWLWIF